LSLYAEIGGIVTQMKTAPRLVLLLVLPAAAFAATPAPKSSILLYPDATVEISAQGVCAVVTNLSPHLLHVPTGEGWKPFVEGR
jgi:hypothetical protein